ncbi:MAG: hypothetical protein KJ601_04855 [Nanoarchaeota archaeon]|nr:hypothetical protein [Nanoarchaeota archaeon]MBU1705080.1 hypothetical protein [Nanoarchaeota archaeon]
MPKKTVTKDKICISIDKNLHSRLKKYCDDHMIKLSTYLEYLIRKGEKGEK